MDLIVKLLPFLGGIASVIALFIGKRVYDAGIKAKERQAINNELLKAEKQKTDAYLGKEKDKTVHSIPILERVPANWDIDARVRSPDGKIH